MSKTYRKNVRVGICGGTNTEFYRGRRRKNRRTTKTQLHNVVTNGSDEDIENVSFDKLPKRDDYTEPTDGSVTYHHTDKNSDLQNSKLLRNLKKNHHAT